MSNTLREIVPDSSGLIKKKKTLSASLCFERRNFKRSEAERSCREGV